MAEAVRMDAPAATARVIAVMNQKGGVGKTTTALNLSHAFARSGQRVLALDLDPQGQLGVGLGVPSAANGMDQILLSGAAMEDAATEVREGLQLVVAGTRLGEVEHGEPTGSRRGYHLRDALQGATDGCDLVVVDCPPSSGLLGMNALLAATDVLMPVSSDYLALHGLSRLIGVLQKLEQVHGHRARKWLVLTRYQERRRLAREVRSKLLSHFPGRVLATEIRESVVLSESPSFGKTIFEYRPKSRSAEEYACLAEDFIQARTMQVANDE